MNEWILQDAHCYLSKKVGNVDPLREEGDVALVFCVTMMRNLFFIKGFPVLLYL